MYWFERTPLKLGSNFENRNVLISIWANTDTLTKAGVIERPNDSQSIKKIYLSYAEPIAKYWDEQSASLNSTNELLFTFASKNIVALLVLVSLPLALFSIYLVLRKTSLSAKMQKLYHQLSTQDRYIIEALLYHQSGSGWKHSTGSSIAQSYQIISKSKLSDDQLANMLRQVRKTGFLKESIASVNDESLLVWRINFRVTNGWNLRKIATLKQIASTKQFSLISQHLRSGAKRLTVFVHNLSRGDFSLS